MTPGEPVRHTFSASLIEHLVDQSFKRAKRGKPTPSQCADMAFAFNRLFVLSPATSLPPAPWADKFDETLALPSPWMADGAVEARRATAFRTLWEAISLPTPQHFFPDADEDRSLANLRDAMTAARPHLFPMKVRVRPWAAGVLMLSGIVEAFMREAGANQIAKTRNTQLAHFLELLLPFFTEENGRPIFEYERKGRKVLPERGAIAQMLADAGAGQLITRHLPDLPS